MSAKNTSPSAGDSSVCGFVNKLFITMAATISDSRKEQPNGLTGTNNLPSLIITQAQRKFYSLLIHYFVLKLLTVGKSTSCSKTVDWSRLFPLRTSNRL